MSLGAVDDGAVGRVAQALIHFDRVSLLATSAEALEPLLDWFVTPGEIETLLLYLRDGVVDFVDMAPGEAGGFRERVLEHTRIATLMKGQHRHARLKSFTSGRVREVTLAEGGEGAFTSVALAAAHAMSTDLCIAPADGATIRAELTRFAGDARVQAIETAVRFPAVSRQVRAGTMDLRSVIDLRRRARPLRAWLQTPERGPIEEYVALHDAVGRDATASESWRLSLFGALRPASSMQADAVWTTWQPVIFDAD